MIFYLISIALYCLVVYLFGFTLYKDIQCTEKVTYPIILWILVAIVLFIPGVNFLAACAGLALVFMKVRNKGYKLPYYSDEDDFLYSNSWLFKCK